MLEKLSTLTTKRYRPALLIWIAVLLFGFWSYTSLLDREGFPPIEVPFVSINGAYFVDDATEVDQAVTRPISGELDAIDEVVSIQSQSRSDSFGIFVELSDSITSAEGADIIEQRLNSNDDLLPDEAIYSVSPISATLFNNQFNALISVYAHQDVELTELVPAAESLSERLEAKAGISEAIIEEQTTESINPETGELEVRQTSFTKYGENVDGSIKTNRAVTIGIVAEESIDDLELDEILQPALSEWNAENEPIQATVSAGYADIIKTQINSLQSNVVTGLLVVIAVVGLVIGWRASVLIAFFIPTVLSATLIGILASDNTLNTIVLFGLVLVLGLIVDNAIVMTEALDTASRRLKRKKAEAIIKDAVSKVGLAIVAGTLTTVLVFAPILFVTGVLGEFIQILPLTVIIALLLSLLIALIYIPFFANVVLLRSKREPKPLLGGVIAAADKLVLALPKRLPKMSKKSRIATLSGSIFISLLIMAVGVYSIGQLPFNIFPTSKDADALLVQVNFGENSTLEQSLETSEQINQILSETLGDDGAAISYLQANAQSAVIRVALTPFTERDTTSQTYIEAIESRLESEVAAQVSIAQLDAGPPAEAFPFAVQIQSEDIDASIKLAEDIATFLKTEEITRSDGSLIEISEVRTEADVNVIRRSDGNRFVEVLASYEDTDVSGLVTATQSAVEQEFGNEELRERGLPADTLGFDFGQESENIDSFASVQIALVLAVVLMYFLLVLQFNSFSQPLLILLTVPFGLIGVAFGLSLTDHSLSFFVMVGLIGLIGIVVNNAILLIDYANQARRDGASVYEAIIYSLELRFRPIVATTLTTIGALTPLALSDPFWEPLAVTIIFGLIASTILVVSALPYFYIVFEQLREKKNKRFPSLS